MNENTTKQITVISHITEKDFHDFAVFDTLIRQRRLTSPLVFSAMFFLFAVICFVMHGKSAQASLLGFVMLGIALIFPGVYFGNFLYSIKKKAAALKLGSSGRHAYTIQLADAPDGITISSAMQSQGMLRLNWSQLYHAYRTADCIYLYASPRQAFLLPEGSADVSQDELWDYLKQKMTADKITDRRK